MLVMIETKDKKKIEVLMIDKNNENFYDRNKR